MGRNKQALIWLGIKPGPSNPGSSNPAAGDTYTVSGSIVDGSAVGIEGVLVTLSGDASDTDTTGVDGAYEFTLPPGSYTVTPTKDNYTFADPSENVTVVAANVTVDNMVGVPEIVLPASYNFNDLVSGNNVKLDVLPEAGWEKEPTTYNIHQATTDHETDGQGYTYPSATKILEGLYTAGPVASLASHEMPGGTVFPAGTAGLRLSFAFYQAYNGSTLNNEQHAISISNLGYAGGLLANSDTSRLKFGLRSWNFATYYWIYYKDPSTLYGALKSASTAAWYEGATWMTARFEVNFAAKTTYFRIFKDQAFPGGFDWEDSGSSITCPDATEEAMNYINIDTSGSSDAGAYGRYAGLWFGGLTDDWPTPKTAWPATTAPWV